VLLLAFLASRSCAGTRGDVDQDEAVEIAKEEVAFEPESVQVRFFRRGIPSVGLWAVSLSTLTDAGEIERRTLVVVHAGTGEVEEVQQLKQ
jgi:hypothetical protein